MISQGTTKKGFTLIELMLVVIIIGVLVAMVVPRLAGRTQQAKIAAAKADIEANISLALDLYEVDNGYYPTGEQGLGALRTKPSSAPAPDNWNGPYLKKRPVDPWGNPYKYVSPGAHNTQDYDLSSFGPDGAESEDDIINWED
jgi:general secretion pathway protein G